MSKITYTVVPHEGGWAYKLEDSFSESFPTYDEALQAARRAAREQHQAGETATISWEDKSGRWHNEVSDGRDRPDVEAQG